MERAISDYMDKGMSIQKIIEQLNERHFPVCERQTSGWLECSRRFYRNKTLMGTCTLKGVEYPDYYPALIDKTRFDALQES